MAGVTTITIPNEEQPKESSAPSSAQAVETNAAINQAENYRAMKERFEQTQSEAQQTRLELQMLKEQQTNDRAMYQQEIQTIREQNSKLLKAIEEEEEEIQQQESSNGATIVTPPITAVIT